jgi:integrase
LISYTQNEIDELLESKPFWGYMKNYIRDNTSIQQLTFRMLKREKKSWHTLRRYFEGIRKMTDFLKVDTPDHALLKIKASSDTAELVDDYISYLVNKELTPINIKAHFFGVKKWLITNRVRVDWEFIGKPKAATRIRDRVPTREELRRILNTGNLRDKALFMTAFSSGLRAGTLVKLKVKDFQSMEDVAMVEVEGGEGKKLGPGKWYFTFVTAETRQVVEDYLATRDTTPESPLFSRFDKEEFFDRYITNVSRQWRKLVKRAKLAFKVKNHNWMELHLHVLRKYFQTSCKLAGVPPDFYDFWMGHVSSKKEEYLNDSYFRATVEEHLKQYRKAIPSLTVFSDVQLEAEELRHKIAELEKLLGRVAVLEKKLTTKT